MWDLVRTGAEAGDVLELRLPAVLGAHLARVAAACAESGEEGVRLRADVSDAPTARGDRACVLHVPLDAAAPARTTALAVTLETVDHECGVCAPPARTVRVCARVRWAGVLDRAARRALDVLPRPAQPPKKKSKAAAAASPGTADDSAARAEHVLLAPDSAPLLLRARGRGRARSAATPAPAVPPSSAPTATVLDVPPPPSQAPTRRGRRSTAAVAASAAPETAAAQAPPPAHLSPVQRAGEGAAAGGAAVPVVRREMDAARAVAVLQTPIVGLAGYGTAAHAYTVAAAHDAELRRSLADAHADFARLRAQLDSVDGSASASSAEVAAVVARVQQQHRERRAIVARLRTELAGVATALVVGRESMARYAHDASASTTQ